MLVSEFQYELPAELIAQQPPAVRGASRMMRLDRASGAVEDRHFLELPDLLAAGDLLVVNDSRVMPSRLAAVREGLTTQAGSPAPSGQVEILLTQKMAEANTWAALARPAKKVRVGERLMFFAKQGGEPKLRATVIGEGEFGERTLRFDAADDFHAALEQVGSLPLPPYIHRERSEPNTREDRERYQTVYSRALRSAEERGSAAAPTAGLHFTPEVLERLEARGVEVARLTLHVGLGTFQPVRAERTEDIRLHAEEYTLRKETAEAVRRAINEERRIVAVGTTTTRTLEHIARLRDDPAEGFVAHEGSTSLFLSPGLNDKFHDPFKVVSGLVTNFHLPGSTLLMLVSAFAGRERVLAAYRHAVEERYRFFSYGDCMLLL